MTRRLRRVGYLVVAFLVSKRTLAAAVEQRTDERDQARDQAARLVNDRDAALREVVAARAERDVARGLAADLARQTGFASTLSDIARLEQTEHDR